MPSKWTDRLGRAVGLRLAVWYAAVFLASSLVLVVLTYLLLATSLERRDREIVTSTLREYAARYQAGGLRALASAIDVGQRAGRYERLFVRVVGPGREAVFMSMPPEWGDFDVGALGPEAPPHDWTEARAADRSAVLEVASARLGDGTLIQVGKSTESRDELLRRFRAVVATVSVVVLASGLIGGLILTRSTLRPLHRLVEVVTEIVETGRTDVRVPVHASRDAVDELSALFNRMLDRITGLMQAMRDSLDNVAHDLRTPLARFRASAESALASGDPGAQREALADCLEESDRILALLDSVRDITEAEAATLRLQRATVSVRDVVNEVVELYEGPSEEKSLTISVKDVADVHVRADPQLMRRLLANLLDNAVKYTPAGGSIAFSARDGGQMVAVAISDTGPGIATEDVPRIWDRLYRADRSRTERGLGLGLSLVKALVEAQDGRVDVETAPEKGSTFIVYLPRAESADLTHL